MPHSSNLEDESDYISQISWDFQRWPLRFPAPARPCDSRRRRREQSPPPKEPSTPSEVFVNALHDGMAILGVLRSEDALKNITLVLEAQEIPGDTDGYFQDDPTWRLRLTLSDPISREQMLLILDEFNGPLRSRRAPTWLRLLTGPSFPMRSAQFVREHVWVLNVMSYLGIKPGLLEERDCPVWNIIWDFVWRVKETSEECSDMPALLEHMGNLSIGGGAELWDDAFHGDGP
ncbi:hypothetical protein BN946_scf184943.g26 [Trametes cinnabarina]|uniref:Uncharacterized protein n=1 Tax=Pycnoporus cinnabarinus TaxID=5643 RepID=A0A060SCP5_PYCCI|nr:hypothetical protein BN946_scf184943.g26 [Trametes cinnabarina]